MGAVASTPRGDVHPKEHGDYLLGLFVGEKTYDIHSRLWERLLSLPLTLEWPDTVIDEACKKIAQNSTLTGHFAKLLFHLAWSLQEAGSASGSDTSFLKATNAVRLSSVFLKYFIEGLTSEQLMSCLSLCLTEKEAEATKLAQGNQNVAGFVVSAMLSFICHSDVNPSTYLLHLEVVNLLLVMMSTQLHTPASSGPKDGHPFLDAAMQQERILVGLVVRKLLLSYTARLPLPQDATHVMNSSNKTHQHGVLQRVGSAAATVLWLPYYTYSYLVSSNHATGTSPLAQNSLLLLLVLVHHHKGLQSAEAIERKVDGSGDDAAAALAHLCLVPNPFCQALDLARDTEFDIVDIEGKPEGGSVTRIPFAPLYDVLGFNLMDEGSLLLLYSLVHGNVAFLEYVLVRTDLDTLLMPLLEMLYDAPRKTPKQIYMLLIIILILSQDSTFNASIHKLVLPSVPWYKERLLTQTTLGSLMVVLLIRTVKFNLSKLRDVYLHTNCLATLSNMAPHVNRLNSYAAQRLVSLFDMLSRKYIKLADGKASSKSLDLKENLIDGPEAVDDLPTELHVYTDFLRIVLEIINAILTYALPRNPEVVYALLHQQELFQPFRNHPRFYELIENIYTVLDFFNSRMDAHSKEGEWSVEKVLQVIIANTRSWRGDGMKILPQLRFTYEEEQHPEEFFVPYVWQLVVSNSGIAWDFDSITLFPRPLVVEVEKMEDSVKTFEMEATPRVEV